MFIKYLEHEIKSTIKPILFISGLIIITGLLFVLTIKFGLNKLLFITTPAYSISLLGGSFYIVVCVVKSIYQRIFNKEGYLTLCLPLKVKDIVLVKILNATILYGIYAIGLTLSLSFFTLLFGVDARIIEEFLTIIQGNFLFILLSLIFGLLSLILFVSVLLFIMSVFNVKAVKNKVIMGILFFILLTTIYSFVAQFDFIGYYINSVGSKLVFSTYGDGFNIFGKILDIIAIVGLNWISIYLIKNKIELE